MFDGAERYRSRAEVIRLAVGEWLASRRAERVDEAVARGYRVTPPGLEEDEWAELSVQVLRPASLTDGHPRRGEV